MDCIVKGGRMGYGIQKKELEVNERPDCLLFLLIDSEECKEAKKTSQVIPFTKFYRFSMHKFCSAPPLLYEVILMERYL